MRDPQVSDLADRYWETLLELSPTFATFVGDHRYDDRLEDLSAEADAVQRARLAALEHAVEEVDVTSLEPPDQVTVGLLRSALADAIEGIDLRLVELRSDQMEGVHVDLLQTTGVLGVDDPADAARIVERFHQVPRMLDQALQRFRDGVDAGRSPARICIERSLRVLDGYLATPLDDDVFVGFSGPDGLGGRGGLARRHPRGGRGRDPPGLRPLPRRSWPTSSPRSPAPTIAPGSRTWPTVRRSTRRWSATTPR